METGITGSQIGDWVLHYPRLRTRSTLIPRFGDWYDWILDWRLGIAVSQIEDWVLQLWLWTVFVVVVVVVVVLDPRFGD